MGHSVVVIHAQAVCYKQINILNTLARALSQCFFFSSLFLTPAPFHTSSIELSVRLWEKCKPQGPCCGRGVPIIQFHLPIS